jgi:hypothetical protein
MREFIYSGLTGICLHALQPKVLLVAAIAIVLWTLVSVPAGLLIGRAMRLFGHKGDLPREIVEAPREMPSRGRVA